MRHENMDVVQCDKCFAKDTLAKDSPDQAKWHDCSRITGDGKEQKFLLCEKHYNEYREQMLTADKEFDAWMKKG